MPRTAADPRTTAGLSHEGDVIPDAAATGRARAAARCEWCGRQLPVQDGTGRRRKYCGQSCRQRAYEDRNARQRHELPADAVVISAAERDDLADRLFQMLCAAEDVATALKESASRAELADLVDTLLSAAHAAERLR
jgi:Lon protease-like protein